MKETKQRQQQQWQQTKLPNKSISKQKKKQIRGNPPLCLSHAAPFPTEHSLPRIQS